MSSYRSKQGSYIEILRAVEMGLLRGSGPLDNKLRDYYIRTLIRGGCPASLILDPGRTSRNFNEDDDTLKLYLPFDETSGSTAHDLSGNGNTGTASGTTIVDGVFGKARKFDGVDDYVDCGTSLRIAGGKTFEFWAKPAVQEAVANGFLGLDNDSADDRWYIDDNNCEGDIRLAGVTGGVQDLSLIVEDILAYDVWQHITVVDTGSTWKVYVNAVFKGSGENSFDLSSLPAGCVFHVGKVRHSGDYRFFKGPIDEVRIYSRALTADEIYLHYLTGALKLGLI